MRFKRVKLEKDFIEKVENLYKKEGSDILRIADAVDAHGLEDKEMFIPIENGNSVEKLNEAFWCIKYKSFERTFYIYIRKSGTEFVFEKLDIE